MKKRKLWVTILAIVIGVLTIYAYNTINGRPDIDPFYTDKGDLDWARIPLLKPYETLSISKDMGWGVNLNGYDGDTGLPHLKKVAVQKGILFLYNSDSTILHGEYVKEAWHVIIPNRHIEKGFATHKEYLNYLDSIGIAKEPHLLNIEAVSEYYDNHDIIDWKAIKD